MFQSTKQYWSFQHSCANRWAKPQSCHRDCVQDMSGEKATDSPIFWMPIPWVSGWSLGMEVTHTHINEWTRRCVISKHPNASSLHDSTWLDGAARSQLLCSPCGLKLAKSECQVHYRHFVKQYSSYILARTVPRLPQSHPLCDLRPRGPARLQHDSSPSYSSRSQTECPD